MTLSLKNEIKNDLFNTQETYNYNVVDYWKGEFTPLKQILWIIVKVWRDGRFHMKSQKEENDAKLLCNYLKGEIAEKKNNVRKIEFIKNEPTRYY